jgi:endonuclease/exonuclease/phosphatase family metal-dependent hydrolase
VRVLSWNLFHGRSLPAAGEELSEQFAALIAGWDWDVALLQEVPPWWPPALAARAGARHATALTSRNSLLALRRVLATRAPDLLKSNGGGANAILARDAIVRARCIRLRVWPERRVAQLARLADGVSVANFHASAREPLAEAELERLWAAAVAWAEGEPLVLGGDLNLRAPPAPAGAQHVARRDVDHIFALGLRPRGEPALLERAVTLGGRVLQLSDHPPLLAELAL